MDCLYVFICTVKYHILFIILLLLLEKLNNDNKTDITYMKDRWV